MLLPSRGFLLTFLNIKSINTTMEESAYDLLVAGLKRFLNLPLTTPEDEGFESFLSDSSALIGDVIYDPEMQELYVQYEQGSRYTYYNVSLQRFKAFENAASRGKYINFKIKPNYLYSQGAF